MVAACLAAGDAAAEPAASVQLTPPVPRGDTRVLPPADAPPLTVPVQVEVRLFLDEEGEVTRVELASDAWGVWGQAVLLQATQFHFAPALDQGEPVASGLLFRQEFNPGSVPAAHTVSMGQLEGVLVEKGTRQPVVGAEVHALASGIDVAGRSDKSGHFSLQIPEGLVRVKVTGASYKEFSVQESMHADEVIRVRYLVERSHYAAYETLVVGKRDRTELARTSLRGAELNQIPGTFGDPFRVITALPGVGTVFSLVGYPVVRGTSPGSTGFMLDGVAVPELFHLLLGPSVLHPEFIDRVDFYPGTFPSRYGEYIGGIVDGITRRALPDEKRIDITADLTQAGAFLRYPLPFGFTGTVAGRYGYPSLLLKAFQAPLGLTYWDYQARLDGMIGPGHFKLFAFGALDELSNVGPTAAASSLAFGTQFHRIDLAYGIEGDLLVQQYSAVFGYDETLAGGTVSDQKVFMVRPRARWTLKLLESFKLNAGLEGAIRRYSGSTNLFPGQSLSSLDSLSGFVEAPWSILDDFIVVPGLRVDGYQGDNDVRQLGIDPRLAMRLRVGSVNDGDVWLKAGGGRYHQPPRSVLPLPGLDQAGLQQGLLASWQSSAGAEIPVASATDLDVQAYFNYMDPIILDLAVNYDPLATVNQAGAGASSPASLLENLLAKQVGRSYGLEVILRRRDVGNFFGWLSYTLSRSERLHSGIWAAFDFDRTHMLQAVASWRLPRNWQIGGRVQFETGRPTSVNGGYNNGRAADFYRIDLRIDKRAVWNDWILDFYVDIINTTLSPEYLNETLTTLHYILPTVGFRAVL